MLGHGLEQQDRHADALRAGADVHLADDGGRRPRRRLVRRARVRHPADEERGRPRLTSDSWQSRSTPPRTTCSPPPTPGAQHRQHRRGDRPDERRGRSVQPERERSRPGCLELRRLLVVQRNGANDPSLPSGDVGTSASVTVGIGDFVDCTVTNTGSAGPVAAEDRRHADGRERQRAHRYRRHDRLLLRRDEHRRPAALQHHRDRPEDRPGHLSRADARERRLGDVHRRQPLHGDGRRRRRGLGPQHGDRQRDRPGHDNADELESVLDDDPDRSARAAGLDRQDRARVTRQPGRAPGRRDDQLRLPRHQHRQRPPDLGRGRRPDERLGDLSGDPGPGTCDRRFRDLSCRHRPRRDRRGRRPRFRGGHRDGDRDGRHRRDEPAERSLDRDRPRPAAGPRGRAHQASPGLPAADQDAAQLGDTITYTYRSRTSATST